MKSPNPPAFPRAYAEDTTGDYNVGVQAQEGMTLRDYFAAAAMQVLLIKLICPDDDLAMDAYQVADAMLKERSK